MLWNEFLNFSEGLHPRTWVNAHHMSPYDNPVDCIKVTAVKTSDHTKVWMLQCELYEAHGVQFPTVLDFSLLKIVQTGSGAHQALCKMGTGGFPGREVTTHLYLVSRLRIHGAYNSTPPYHSCNSV